GHEAGRDRAPRPAPARARPGAARQWLAERAGAMTRAHSSDPSSCPESERAPLPRALLAPARGRVLLLAPHADDDVLGAGGTCALHVRQGDPLHVIVAYDGVEGDPERRF